MKREGLGKRPGHCCVFDSLFTSPPPPPQPPCPLPRCPLASLCSVTNLKYWTSSSVIVQKTLQLLNDLSVGWVVVWSCICVSYGIYLWISQLVLFCAIGSYCRAPAIGGFSFLPRLRYSSVRKLVKLESVQFILENHTVRTLNYSLSITVYHTLSYWWFFLPMLASPHPLPSPPLPSPRTVWALSLPECDPQQPGLEVPDGVLHCSGETPARWIGRGRGEVWAVHQPNDRWVWSVADNTPAK